MGKFLLILTLTHGGKMELQEHNNRNQCLIHAGFVAEYYSNVVRAECELSGDDI